MKLWQYITVVVLMFGSLLLGAIGSGGNYILGYDAGYEDGYMIGIFDEGWNAAAQHNTTHQNIYGETFYLEEGVWIVTIPAGDHIDTFHYDGMMWAPAGQHPLNKD